MQQSVTKTCNTQTANSALRSIFTIDANLTTSCANVVSAAVGSSLSSSSNSAPCSQRGKRIIINQQTNAQMLFVVTVFANDGGKKSTSNCTKHKRNSIELFERQQVHLKTLQVCEFLQTDNGRHSSIVMNLRAAHRPMMQITHK